MQIGGGLQHAVGEGRLHTGMMLGYGSADTRVISDLSGRDAKGKVMGTSVGVYGTWYQNAQAPSGLYLDSWLQYRITRSTALEWRKKSISPIPGADRWNWVMH